MRTDIPRLTHHNAAIRGEPNSRDVTWWALVGLVDPPLAVGRDPGEAERYLHAALLRYHREEAEPLPEDPEARALRDLKRWTDGALLSGTARDEVAAFLSWRLVSNLTREEALLRWREAFPAPEGADPLAGLLTARSVAPATDGARAVGSYSAPQRGGGRRRR